MTSKTNYGLTQRQIRMYRVALAYGASFGYVMAQMAQTYRARKAMYKESPNG